MVCMRFVCFCFVFLVIAARLKPLDEVQSLAGKLAALQVKGLKQGKAAERLAALVRRDDTAREDETLNSRFADQVQSTAGQQLRLSFRAAAGIIDEALQTGQFTDRQRAAAAESSPAVGGAAGSSGRGRRNLADRVTTQVLVEQGIDRLLAAGGPGNPALAHEAAWLVAGYAGGHRISRAERWSDKQYTACTPSAAGLVLAAAPSVSLARPAARRRGQQHRRTGSRWSHQPRPPSPPRATPPTAPQAVPRQHGNDNGETGQKQRPASRPWTGGHDGRNLRSDRLVEVEPGIRLPPRTDQHHLVPRDGRSSPSPPPPSRPSNSSRGRRWPMTATGVSRLRAPVGMERPQTAIVRGSTDVPHDPQRPCTAHHAWGIVTRQISRRDHVRTPRLGQPTTARVAF
eukprot:SAG22_NODE_280_length_13084_cov_3.480209_4_plen_400_part_00